MKCQVKSCPETTAKPRDDGWLHVRGMADDPPGGAWYCRAHGKGLMKVLGDPKSVAKVDADGKVIPGTHRFVMPAGRA
jgi:hypothetical protein